MYAINKTVAYIYTLQHMRTYIILFLLVVASYKSKAQHTFLNIFESPYSVTTNSVIQTQHNSYLLIVNEKNFQNGQYNGVIYTYNEFGQAINLLSLDGPNGGTIHTIDKFNNNYIIGGTKDSVVHEQQYQTRYISIINDELEVLHSINLPAQLDTVSDIKQIKKISDSVVLVLENYRNTIPPLQAKFRVWKINLYTGINRVYDPNMVSPSAFDLLYDPDNNQIVVSYMGNYIEEKRDAVAKTLILDTLLNYVDCISAPEDMFAYMYMEKYGDNSYLISSLGDISSKESYRAIYLYEMSMAHDSMNAVYIHPQNPVDTIVYPFFLNPLTANENKIAVGINYNVQPIVGLWQTIPSWVLLTFLDPELNLTKQVYYGDGQKIYLGMDIRPTSDDGYIICGITKEISASKFDYFLLKVNSEGLITGMEEPKGICASEALVYPNPGGEQFQVKLAAQHQNALLEMYSLNGKMLLSEQLNQAQTTINAQALPQGCYTYRITSNGQKIANGKWVKE